MARRISKSDDPLAPIFFRPEETVATRLNAVCKRHKKTRIAVAEEGMLAEIERLEQRAPSVSAAEAKALAELKRLKIDPLPHLEAIIAEVASAITAAKVEWPAAPEVLPAARAGS